MGRKAKVRDKLKWIWRALKQEQGVSMTEYALILALVVVPMYLMFEPIRQAVIHYYAMIAFVVGLPFP